MVAPLIVGGLALGAGGQVANFMGGRSEAKRRDAAISAYRQRSSELYDQMAKDAWAAGGERQRATGKVLEGLPAAMGADAGPAPQASGFLPVADNGDTEAYRAAMAQVFANQGELDQGQLDLAQTGMSRDAMMRALGQLETGAGIESQVQAPAHVRYQWLKQQQLEEAKAQLEAVLGSIGNKSRNLQLLGSLLGTAGTGMMMAGAFGGGPAAGATGGAGQPVGVAGSSLIGKF